MNLFRELYLIKIIIGFFPIIIILIFGLFKYTKYNFFFFYIASNLSIEIIENFVPFRKLFGFENNYFLFFIDSFLNIFLIYKFYFPKNKKIRTIAFLMMVFVPFTILINKYNFSSLIFTTCFEALFTIAISFLYLIRLHKNYEGENLRKEPMVWFSVALLLNYIVRFLFYAFSKNLMEYSLELMRLIGNFFLPLTEIFASILITIGIYFVKKNRTN